MTPYEPRGFSNEKIWGFVRLDMVALLAIQTWQYNLKQAGAELGQAQH